MVGGERWSSVSPPFPNRITNPKNICKNPYPFSALYGMIKWILYEEGTGVKRILALGGWLTVMAVLLSGCLFGLAEDLYRLPEGSPGYEDLTQRINEALNLKMEELDRVIDRAGKVLSQISDYPVFTMAAARERVTVKRFDLLMVEENAFIAVVMTDSSVVKNKLIHIPDGLSDPQLQMLSAVLNSSFVGLSREEMEETLDKMETRTAPGAFELIAMVVEFAMEVLAGQSEQKFRTAGITHLLEHPEYRSLDKAKPLMAYLSEEGDAPKLPATLDTGKNMNILIGPENVNDALKDTSVVMASYDIGDNMRGVIGVVGPTRMDYAKISARLSYFAKGLSWIVSQGGLPPGTEEPK